MESLSVIIPAWSGTSEIIEMTLALAQQVRPMCDELVISEDGSYSKELEEISDIYLLHPRLGHGVNLNLGFRASTCEYVALLDSDVAIESGSLRDMVIPERVVCPFHPAFAPFQGWFVVAPRWIIAECPPYDRTDHHGEGIDFWAEELWNLTRDRLITTDKVTYSHQNSGSYAEFRRQGNINNRIADGKLRERMETLRQLHDARKMEDAATARVMASRMPRELDIMRHKQRLLEDTHYRRVWLHSL